ncbi:hypothetical protein BDA96_10G284000 [Sorghum bicolor]|uniref:Uncharacterized protein n=2 Tax=Sorghum bicolor TaxID=4558 RepID=A0A194YLS9_SORBI|nr:hypothetical protein BDA96_10G284000 [Sorghum bicolor]KXG20546.1 hypothetical protein SORBI_3010G219300 [Sorghum bicolor]
MAASFSGAVLCRIVVAVLIVSTLYSSNAEAKYDCYGPCNDCPHCNGWCQRNGYPEGGQCLPKGGAGIFCCCER